MSINIRTHAVDYLFDAILSLENREECYSFFEDICTVNEILSLSQRFEVAAMLRAKKTYLEIAEETGFSTQKEFEKSIAKFVKPQNIHYLDKETTKQLFDLTGGAHCIAAEVVK